VCPHSAIPDLLQLGEVTAAFFLKPKVVHGLVSQKEIPLVGVPVLEDAAASKVMLAHRPGQGMNGLVHQRKRLA
jgi:hypothetical protein